MPDKRGYSSREQSQRIVEILQDFSLRDMKYVPQIEIQKRLNVTRERMRQLKKYMQKNRLISLYRGGNSVWLLRKK
jgi:hypothetical protein